MEYKIEAVSKWNLGRLTEMATAKANELARDGWKLEKMRNGWKGYSLTPTIYLVFERDRK